MEISEQHTDIIADSLANHQDLEDWEASLQEVVKINLVPLTPAQVKIVFQTYQSVDPIIRMTPEFNHLKFVTDCVARFDEELSST